MAGVRAAGEGLGSAQKLKGPGALYRGLCAMSAGVGRKVPGTGSTNPIC
jgi:hypothetical protein